MKKEINDLLLKMQTGENCIGETANQLLHLFAVSNSLPSKDEVVGRGFNSANGSEYNRRNVLRDADDDLYYTGWMDCYDWLSGNER